MPENDDTTTATPEITTGPADAAPWGDDFNAETAWGLIQNLRDDVKAAKADKTPQSEKDARALATLRRQLDEAAPKLAEYDRQAEASKTELQKAQEAAQKQSERAQALLDRAVKAEVKSVASQGFADPEDATAFLDLKKYAGADGEIDTESISADLADLLARKPHLGKQPAVAAPVVPQPNPAQGSSGSGPAAPAQLSRDDVKRMYANKQYQEIADAQADGRLTALYTHS